MFLLLTLNVFHTFSSVSIVDFKQVNFSWVTNPRSQSVSAIIPILTSFFPNEEENVSLFLKPKILTPRICLDRGNALCDTLVFLVFFFHYPPYIFCGELQ